MGEGRRRTRQRGGREGGRQGEEAGERKRPKGILLAHRITRASFSPSERNLPLYVFLLKGRKMFSVLLHSIWGTFTFLFEHII